MTDSGFCDWERLPNWSQIFDYLDVKSLLNASLVCKSFDNYASSARMMRKLKLKIRFPEYNEAEQIEKFKDILKNHSLLTRKYQRLEILKIRDSFFIEDNIQRKKRVKGKAKEHSIRTNLIATCHKLGQSVTDLSMQSCNVSQKDLTEILRPFVNVTDLILTEIVLSDDLPFDDTKNFNISFPHLKSLRLAQCDFFCLILFAAHDKLETLELKNPSYVRDDVERFENFLMSQSKLKCLSLKNFRFNSTYSTNRLGSVPFQLEVLKLNNVKWDIGSHMEIFVKSQRSLKVLKLKSIHQWLPPHEDPRFFPGVLKGVLARNPGIQRISFDSRFYQDVKSVDFLEDTTTPTVTHLSYFHHDSNSKIFEGFTRAFPNVKSLKYKSSITGSEPLQHVARFTELESMVLGADPEALGNLTLGSDKLRSFSFYALNEKKSLNLVGEFIARNPKISHLSLNIEPATFEEVSAVLMTISSTLEHLTISDLHLNPTEAEILVKNFPKCREVCSDLSLTPEIIEILSTHNIRYQKIVTQFLPNYE